MMEADEPGRCRRTDGKKGKTWRCKNDVVPNAKYCERHIHRGCNRSRKLVEGCGSNRTASRPSSTSRPPQQPSLYETPQSNSTKNLENLSDVSCNLTPSRARVGDDAPVTIAAAASEDVRACSSDPTSQENASTILGLGFKPTNRLVTATLGAPKSKSSSENILSTDTVELVDAAYSNGIGKEHTIVIGSSKAPSDSMAATLGNVTCLKIMNKDVDFASSSCATSTTAISMVAKTESGNRRSHGSNNGQSIGHNSTSKRTTHIRGIEKLKVNTSLGVNFSPKSVLRDANDHCPNPSVQDGSPLCFYRSDSEVQPWRCRRTDGRKWRCRKDVLPDQKYCAMHMHRGAKKQVQHSQLADLPSSKRSKSTHPRPNQSLPSKEKYSSLNTDLSICALEISRPTEDDEPSTACGSSDATISDDNTSYGNN